MVCLHHSSQTAGVFEVETTQHVVRKGIAVFEILWMLVISIQDTLSKLFGKVDVEVAIISFVFHLRFRLSLVKDGVRSRLVFSSLLQPFLWAEVCVICAVAVWGLFSVNLLCSYLHGGKRISEVVDMPKRHGARVYHDVSTLICQHLFARRKKCYFWNEEL